MTSAREKALTLREKKSIVETEFVRKKDYPYNPKNVGKKKKKKKKKDRSNKRAKISSIINIF